MSAVVGGALPRARVASDALRAGDDGDGARAPQSAVARRGAGATRALAFFPDYPAQQLADIATRGAQLAAEAAEVFPQFAAVKMRLAYSCTLEAPAALGAGQIVVHFDVGTTDELISDLINDVVDGLFAAVEGPAQAPEATAPVRRTTLSSADRQLFARIVDLLAAGPLTSSAIANALKRSRSDVAGALTRLLADGAIDTSSVVVRGREREAFTLAAHRTADDSGLDAEPASSASANKTLGGPPPTAPTSFPDVSFRVGAGRLVTAGDEPPGESDWRDTQ
jgi:hypothetical protein